MQLIKLMIASLLLCVSTAAIAQDNTFYPSDSLILAEKFEIRMNRMDSMMEIMSATDSLQILHDKAARLYWGVSTAPVVVTDTSMLDGYCDAYGIATHHYFYLDRNGGKVPDNIMCNGLAYQYYVFDYNDIGALPNLPDNNRLRYVYMRYSPDVPDVFPTTWAQSGDHLQRFYFQRCGYTTAQVDALVVQLEDLVTQGMGTGITGVHYFYMNQTGTNQNETLTLATHLANGWVANSGYISKTINGSDWRVYHN